MNSENLPGKTAFKIYIIYEPSDQSRVEKIYDKLRDKGFNPWMEAFDLLPGEYWDFSRKNNLENSQFVIVCLSNKLKNEEGYHQKEIGFAFDKYEEFPNHSIYIIPIKLEKCEIQDKFKKLKCFDLFCKNKTNSIVDNKQWLALFEAINKGAKQRNLKLINDSYDSGEYYPNTNYNIMIVKLKKLDGREIEKPPFEIEIEVYINGDLKKHFGTGSIEFDYHLVAQHLNKCQDKAETNQGLDETFIKNNIGEYLSSLFFGQDSHRFSDSFELFKKYKKNSDECFFIVFEIDRDYIVDFPIEFLMYKNNNDTNSLVFFEDNRFITFKKFMRAGTDTTKTIKSPLRFNHFKGSNKTEFHIILSNTFNHRRPHMIDIESTKFFKNQAQNLKDNIQNIINKFELNLDIKLLPDEGELDRRISRDDLIDYFNKLDKENNHILHFIGQGINDDNGSKVLLNVPFYMVTEQAIKKISSKVPGIPSSLIQKLKNIENEKFKREKIFSGFIKRIIGEKQFNKYGTEILEYTLLKSENEVDYVNLCDFADEFKEMNIRFVYLNCCYGAAHIQTKSRESFSGLMRSLIYKTEIPSILGFRWPVNNSTANEFAERFYSDFFTNSKYIPEALQNARVCIQHGSNPEAEKIKMCASPILIYQESFVK